jgi:hypothetical protein
VHVEQAKGGMSYMSASDPRIHFGLGKRTKIESLGDHLAQRAGGSIDKPARRPDHRCEGRIWSRTPPISKDPEREMIMNFPRRRFLGSSLLVLGSSLLDALTTPLWQWKRGLILQSASL